MTRPAHAPARAAGAPSASIAREVRRCVLGSGRGATPDGTTFTVSHADLADIVFADSLLGARVQLEDEVLGFVASLDAFMSGAAGAHGLISFRATPAARDFLADLDGGRRDAFLAFVGESPSEIAYLAIRSSPSSASSIVTATGGHR